ncbi:MAG TPA: GNAT family protein [Fimbriimonas sp.]|nr:GNAT family protein [Fimbriimonas sp.]
MLKGQRINLRTVRQSDLTSWLEVSSDIDHRGQYFPLVLHTETAIRTAYEKDGYWSEERGLLLIVDKETDRIIGMMAKFKPVFYYQCVEIGYIIYHPDDRGKGYASEALRLFVRYLFDLMPIDRIQIQVEPGNLASQRVARKCGFTYEGTSRSALMSRGKWVDIDMLSILRSEWRELNPRN